MKQCRRGVHWCLSFWRWNVWIKTGTTRHSWQLRAYWVADEASDGVVLATLRRPRRLGGFGLLSAVLVSPLASIHCVIRCTAGHIPTIIRVYHVLRCAALHSPLRALGAAHCKTHLPGLRAKSGGRAQTNSERQQQWRSEGSDGCRCGVQKSENRGRKELQRGDEPKVMPYSLWLTWLSGQCGSAPSEQSVHFVSTHTPQLT